MSSLLEEDISFTNSANSSFINDRDQGNKFDHRFKTKLSSLLTESSTTLNILDNASLTNSSNLVYDNLVQWTVLKKISLIIYNSNFKLKYGIICSFNLLGEFMVFGTKKGLAIIFDYCQNIKAILGESNKLVMSSGAITSLAISLDSTHIATGHEYGRIFIWTLKGISLKNSGDPILIIEPLKINDKVNGKEGHLINKPISHLHFLNKRHTGVISSDIDGLILFHDGYRGLFGLTYHSTKILGSSDLDFTINNNKQSSKMVGYLEKKTKNYIFGCLPLPLAQFVSKLDSLNLIGVITINAILVIGINPTLTTYFKIGKPKILDPSFKQTCCLSWYPELNESKSEKIGPRLAYCFSNILTIIELKLIQTEGVDDNGDKKIFNTVETIDKKRWVCDESIISVLWLSGKIIAVLTITSRILVIDTGLVKFKLNPNQGLRLIESIDVISNHIIYNNYLKNFIPIDDSNEISFHNKIRLFNSFKYTFQTFKKNIFILTDTNQFTMGTISNWETRIAKLLNEKTYQGFKTALIECLNFYNGDCDLIKYNLTENDETRHSLISTHLIKIISLTFEEFFQKEYDFLKNNDDETLQELTELLDIGFNALVSLNSSPEKYEEIFEFFEQEDFLKNIKTIYFTTLEKYIFNKQINQLSPKILKELVISFNSKIDNGNVQQLEEIICLLNIKEMDLDLIISLCEKYKLIDAKIFIWNSLLKDYIGPFMDFLTIIKKIIYSQFEDRDSIKVYSYLTYILTKRQYPLETLINESNNSINNIKLNLYYILFNGGSIEWPRSSGEIFFVSDNPISEPSFPYLYLLLKFNTEDTLLMLNEIFEDEFLSDEIIIENNNNIDLPYFFKKTFKINRQYIIEILLDIFGDYSDKFELKDEIFLGIFILRNYPKYSQFIRINDSILNNLIDKICQVHDLSNNDYYLLKNDCELSLQSLLTIYHPTNLSDELIFYFEKNQFNNLLFGLYLQEKKSSKLFRLWLNHQHELINENYFLNYEILQLCYDLNDEMFELKELIQKNFLKILEQGNLIELIKIFNENDKSLNKEIYKIDDDCLKFQYCSILFESNYDVNNEDVLNFIKLSCEFEEEKSFKCLQKINIQVNLVDELLEVLKNYNDFDGIIYLLLNVKKDDSQCLDEVLKILEISVFDNDNNDLEKLLWKYLNVGINNCKTITNENFNNGEIAWVKLNQKLSDLIKKVEKISIGDNRTNILKMLLQEVFINLLNMNFQNNKNNKLILRIFNQFLDTTNHSNDREFITINDSLSIIKEILFLNNYQQESLKLILKFYNNEVSKTLTTIEIEKLKGIIPKSSECFGCGKKIYGKKISSKFLQNWEFFQREKTDWLLKNGKSVNSTDFLKEFNFQDEIWKELNLVVFKCCHGYHLQCVKNLGGVDSEGMKCIVCEDV